MSTALWQPSGTEIVFTLSFSERVSGVDKSDFVVTRSSETAGRTDPFGDTAATETRRDALITALSENGANWQITVDISELLGEVMTEQNDWMVTLELMETGTGIMSGGLGFIASSDSARTLGQRYDNKAPALEALTASLEEGETASSSQSVTFSLSFSESVTGLDASDFVITRKTETPADSKVIAEAYTLSGSGSLWRVVIDPERFFSDTDQTRNDWQILFELKSDADITDLAGHELAASAMPSERMALRLYDNAPPELMGITDSIAETTRRWRAQEDSVIFSVSFSESVSGVDRSDFLLYRRLPGTDSVLLDSAIIEVEHAPDDESLWLVSVDVDEAFASVTQESTDWVLQLQLRDDVPNFITGITDSAGNRLEMGGVRVASQKYRNQSPVLERATDSISSDFAKLESTESLVTFTLTFSESVAGLAQSHIGLTLTHPAESAENPDIEMPVLSSVLSSSVKSVEQDETKGEIWRVVVDAVPVFAGTNGTQ